MYLMQKDLEALIAQHDSVELVLKYEQKHRMYEVFVLVLDDKDAEEQRLYTQRKDPKTFRDLHRALHWGERQGFSSVIFQQQWK